VSEEELLRSSREAVDAALITAVAADPVRWGTHLHAALGDLRQAFERHSSAAEAADGTLDEVLKQRPALAHAVRRQRREHVELFADIAALRDELVNALARKTVDPEALRWRVGALQDAVRRHMARGSDLLYEAFYQDDGGEA
jgi:hypothetical protein